MARTATTAKAAVRRRLTVAQRRQELLDLGLEAFGQQGYDDVSVEDIAARAGISTGLLYHYFPSKKAYFLAVLQAAIAQIYQATTPVTDVPREAALTDAVAAYLRHAEAHPQGFLTAHRSAMSSDPDVQQLVRRARERQLERILADVAPSEPAADPVRLAAVGWIAMVYEVTATWLATRVPDADAVAEMLVAALSAATATGVNDVARHHEGAPGRI
ncbi:MAG: TetR/AcrR family transcriptional regulator [Frankiales bacterium]|nr:TetR/AcrR family transcriptional regulator [Frankiales bacterium]